LGIENYSKMSKTKTATILFDFKGDNDDLECKEGDIIEVIKERDDGWTEAKLGEKIGFVPISYYNIKNEDNENEDSSMITEEEVSNIKFEDSSLIIKDDISNSEKIIEEFNKNKKKTGKAKMLYDFKAENEDEIDCKEGDIIEVIKENFDGWTEVKLGEKRGLVPSEYFDEIYEKISVEKIEKKQKEFNPNPKMNIKEALHMIGNQIKGKIVRENFKIYKANKEFKSSYHRFKLLKEVINTERSYLF
jgi:hypothetical protein